MSKQKYFGNATTICYFFVVILAIAVMNPNNASSYYTRLATYAVEDYQVYGPEPDPHWQHTLSDVDDEVTAFRNKMDADAEYECVGSCVSRSTIQDRYNYGFDSYDMVYWHAHSHTLPYNEHTSNETYCDPPYCGDCEWLWDPCDLYNWGKSVNPYLSWYADVYNPSWFVYPCNNNVGPGYTYGDNTFGKTVSLPMWQGYFGRYCGVAVLTLCDLNRLESGGGPGHGLGYYNNEWAVLDSCDSVRVAQPDGEAAVNDGVYAWDQTFDGLHGVYGHYRSITRDSDKAYAFAGYLVDDDDTIWEAYKAASLDTPHTDNKRVSVITAENKQRIWFCWEGTCFWLYPYWDEMTINDHWHNHGYVAPDIERVDIAYFYTQWYDPD